MSEVEMLDQWDRLSHSIDRMLTALPNQMTEAAAGLELERRAMRSTINAWSIARLNPSIPGAN